MRRAIFYVMIGVLLSLPIGVYAEDIANSIIGKTIQGQFPVKIDGTMLEQPAVVIDGTSYLPVRAIGDALNLDVYFDADLGIELKKKGVEIGVQKPSDTPIMGQSIFERGLYIQAKSKELQKASAEVYSLIRDYEIVTLPIKEKDEFYYTQKKIYDEIGEEIQSLYDELMQLSGNQ